MPRIYSDPGFDEEYRVRTYSKESYVLNRQQAKLLDNALKNKFKGRLEFKDFDIFVPNVSDFYFINGTRQMTVDRQLEAPEAEQEISPEEQERREKKKNEIKEKLKHLQTKSVKLTPEEMQDRIKWAQERAQVLKELEEVRKRKIDK